MNTIKTARKAHKSAISSPIRPISQIAADIKKSWPRVPNCAKVYLNALEALNDKNSKFGLDTAPSLINYFLCNASTFKGEQARSLKAELKIHLK
jgi:hypothetical protein